MGLVTLPIYNVHIASAAGILESKLDLDHDTQDLYNYIQDAFADINTALGWINLTGVKLAPHIAGALYNHELSHIFVDYDTSNYLFNRFDTARNNTNAYTLLSDINTDYVTHQKSDGTDYTSDIVTTLNGSTTYPGNYAHTASGLYLNTFGFNIIPQTVTDLQAFAEYLDTASIFLLGTRIQNLYTNGISRSSRSNVLNLDGYGQGIIDPVTATTYLLFDGTLTSPNDSINDGDDIIELKPGSDLTSTNLFDAQFALIKVGDVIRVNYDGVEVTHIVREKNYQASGENKKFYIRIDGKNLIYTTTATVRIDHPLFNNNKYGVLAVAEANNEFAESGSLIVGSPRGAQALGINFNPNMIDANHYNLSLQLYPTGNPFTEVINMVAIDVTGNQGKTPGLYTLDSVVEATNLAFRAAGFNYRFIAFKHEGEFGIMLADHYNDAAFAIIAGMTDGYGAYDETTTNVLYPYNIIDVFDSTVKATDALGFGPANAGLAGPAFRDTYESSDDALVPTRVMVPLERNNFYVNRS